MRRLKMGTYRPKAVRRVADPQAGQQSNAAFGDTQRFETEFVQTAVGQCHRTRSSTIEISRKGASASAVAVVAMRHCELVEGLLGIRVMSLFCGRADTFKVTSTRFRKTDCLRLVSGEDFGSSVIWVDLGEVGSCINRSWKNFASGTPESGTFRPGAVLSPLLSNL